MTTRKHVFLHFFFCVSSVPQSVFKHLFPQKWQRNGMFCHESVLYVFVLKPHRRAQRTLLYKHYQWPIRWHLYRHMITLSSRMTLESKTTKSHEDMGWENMTLWRQILLLLLLTLAVGRFAFSKSPIFSIFKKLRFKFLWSSSPYEQTLKILVNVLKSLPQHSHRHDVNGP